MSVRDYWSANVVQFEDHGPKGISHVHGSCEGMDVDALLFRDKAGKIRGILHYDADRVHEEAAGNVTVFEIERLRRKGIATKLVREAEQRWPVNFDAQDY